MVMRIICASFCRMNNLIQEEAILLSSQINKTDSFLGQCHCGDHCNGIGALMQRSYILSYVSCVGRMNLF